MRLTLQILGTAGAIGMCIRSMWGDADLGSGTVRNSTAKVTGWFLAGLLSVWAIWS